jgi:hypothetical protein
MANADAPFGLRPVMMLDGSPYNGQTIRCQIAAADATATFIGDLVTGSTDAGTEGVPSVSQGAATDTAFLGVVVAFEFDPTDLEQKHRLASTQRACHVVPALDCIFEIQSNGTGALTDILNTADITVGSGDTATGLSTMEIDDTSMGTGLNLQIVGAVVREDNDPTLANANWLVRINESQFRGTGTGVA